MDFDNNKYYDNYMKTGFSKFENKSCKENILKAKKVKENFEILPYTRYASEICGEIKARCKENGKNAAFSDSQIAATAIANGMVLVTHNTADYSPIAEVSNLKFEDWWT